MTKSPLDRASHSPRSRRRLAGRLLRWVPAAAALAAVALLAAPLVLPSARAQSTTPWTAFENYRKTGTITGQGNSKDNDVATFMHVVNVYKIDPDSYKGGDWYRIDMIIESAIKNGRYDKKPNACGWYTDNVNAGFDLLTSRGRLEEWGPPTTVGKSSVSYSIGGTFTTGGPRLNLGYSMTQTVPDAGIKAYEDAPGSAVSWVANLKGCDDPVGSTAYSGASAVAKGTFTLNPTIVVSVPEGAALKFTTYTKKRDTRIHIMKKRGGASNYNVKANFRMTFTCKDLKCSRSNN
ncbi:MAG: hypothetical protein GC201_13690 [Alphaproteobacteria bacterium]|nr:hypothetical protein [Alphaproteobacteria bacterium]